MNRIHSAAWYVLLAAGAYAQAPSYTITTVSGGISPYFYAGTGDGGPANSAGLATPTNDLTVDSTGNVYALAGSLIREINLAGYISTMAGGGTVLDDFFPASQSQFAPLAMAADQNGNLYLADTVFGVSRIRKVDPNGIVTTVAGGGPCCVLGDGGPATSAYISIPMGLAIDSAGNIYFSQVNGQTSVVRQVATNGTISTVAGGGLSTADGILATSASLANPTGIAVDSVGNLYIAETGSNRVREVSGGYIITIAGTGAASNSGDGGPAILAGISGPSRLTFDDSGSLFVTQPSSGLVRRIAPNSFISTIAGKGTQGHSGDGGPAINAGLDNPTGIAIASCGQIYLGEANGGIGRVSLLTPNSISPGSSCQTIQFHYLISGQITLNGKPLPGVSVTLSGSSTGTTQADSNGLYSFANLPSGANYTLTPTLSGYSFNPPSLTFASLGSNQSTANFAAITTSLIPSPLTISFSVPQNSGQPPSQTLTIASSDGTPVPISIAALSAGSWLSVSTKTGTTPQSLSISANPGPFPANPAPYSGTISITPTGPLSGIVQPITIPVSMLISTGAPPQLSVAPSTLSFSGVAGSGAQTGRLQVSSSIDSGSSLTYSVSASGAGWLSVSPLSGTTPGSLTVSANLANLAPGAYTGTISVTAPGAVNSPIPVLVTVTVYAPGSVQATPPSLIFSYQISSSAPAPQSLTISAPNNNQNGFAVSSSAPWLIAGVNSGTTPTTVNIIAVPIGLAASSTPYQGLLTITPSNAPAAPAISVPVSLTVSAPLPPYLSVDTTTLKLSGFTNSGPVTAQIQVSNAGGGALAFAASSSGGSWLTVSPGSGVVDNSSSTSAVAVTVSADPTSLGPGTYQGSVIISGAGSTAAIPVTFTLAAPNPTILISQTALTITAAVQGGAPLPEQIGILNTGTGILNWTAAASTLSGGNWLLLTPPSGTVPRPFLDVSFLSVSIDPTVVATLQPGNYYGQIQIAAQAANSPQVITVLLTVLPQGVDPGPELSPSSVIFTPSGTGQNPQNVTVGIRGAGTDHYDSGQIGAAYTFQPGEADIQPNQPAVLQVAPNFAAAQPGVPSFGTITLQFEGGAPRNVQVLTIAPPLSGSSRRPRPRDLPACGNLTLQWRTPAATPPNFSVVQGTGQTLQVQVVDNCGNLIGTDPTTNPAVLATFSNGDPNLALVHLGNGIWTGTWKPANLSASAVTVAVTAFNSATDGSQTGATTALSAVVVPGTTPTVRNGGILQSASRVGGAPVAPGSLIAILGSNLSAGQNSGSPGDAQLFVGSEPLPIFSASSGEIDAQVPYDVPINTQSQLLVQRTNLLSVPEKIAVADAQPGIFTLSGDGTGPGIVYNNDGSLAQGDTPASVGDTVAILCSGLGAVSPAIPAGVPAPTDTPISAVNAVTVTIAGISASVTSSVLAPGQIGQYLVSAVVPEGSEVGDDDDVPLIVTVNGKDSPTVSLRRPRPTGGTTGNVRQPSGQKPQPGSRQKR